MPIAKKPKVLVGMSGGVDSSVAAALLLEQGYEVVGGFMKNWSDCSWRADKRDATRVAANLGIPLAIFDFEAEYRALVVEDLFRETAAGRTPNPDVLCNKHVKFDLFLREADKLGCDFVATGHYARVKRGMGTSDGLLRNSPSAQTVLAAPSEVPIPAILQGKDKNKDQSYFLWAVDKNVLPRVLFPLGELTKPEVREKARVLGLATAEKKDSTGICFVGEVDMKAFLGARLPAHPGTIVTVDGRVIGTHEGVHFYTIGQRHGLAIGGGEPYYVVEKRPAAKELVVASNSHPALYRAELEAGELNWFRPVETPLTCEARIRYRQPLEPCTIRDIEDGVAHVRFDRAQRAVTPGQSIVFYDGEEMIGGGIIK